MARILIVDDDQFILKLLQGLIGRDKTHEVVTAQGGEKAVELLRQSAFDLMISDIQMAPMSGMQLLKEARRLCPDMAVVLMTAYGSVATAVEALKDGVFDYVTKPLKIDELAITIERALRFHETMAENVTLRAKLARYSFQNIVAESESMRRACALVERVAATDNPVLIRGEHGTGKGLIAQTIHAYSKRKDKRFLPLNLNRLPAIQMVTELFGAAKGVLGEGMPARDGALRQANGGVVMLDEIEHLSLPAQARLVHYFNTRLVIPEGMETEGMPADVRIIATSAADLEAMAAENRFRRDLLQRLAPITIPIPPLRERREDILPLVVDFLRQAVGPGHEVPDIDPEALRACQNYGWPGNVTEVEEMIAQACNALENGRVTLNTLPAAVAAAAVAGAAVPAGGQAPPPRGTALKAFLLDSLKQSRKNQGP
ncbi:MAG: sigma-54 dependent transcriptional regulator [Lentisphaeria bacterium]